MLDLCLQNGKVFNSYLKKFVTADIYIKKDKIYHIDKTCSEFLPSRLTIDTGGCYIIPGLIDIHMHIESSMMTPDVFCDYMAAQGVTTIVSEPHEIANVMGLRGVKDMIKAGENAIIDVFYGIPSCVPTISNDFETTGGKILFDDMKELLKEDSIRCVGEVMNYRQIIKENDSEIGKFLEYLKEIKSNIVIEGHCPALVGEDLSKFLYLGINGDHTEHTLEEIKERFENGMFVEIQEKMLHKWLLEYIDENNLYEHCGFVTDDVMADELIEKGHLNAIVKKAITLGMSPENAVYCATFTPARRMNMHDRGSLAPGKIADFVIVKDMKNFEIIETFKAGQNIYSKAFGTEEGMKKFDFHKDYYESIKALHLTEKELALEVEDGHNHTQVEVRVMVVKDGKTQTDIEYRSLDVVDGKIQWEKEEDICLAIMKERYNGGKSSGIGFVTGDCIKMGAVASTYAHDSHNLLVIGKNTIDIIEAGNHIINIQGGIATAKAGKVTSCLPLPIGGIVTNAPVESTAAALKLVRSKMVEQGYKHYNPIMSLCTLSLPVSPNLKITDKGLIDVKAGEIVPLISKKIK